MVKLAHQLAADLHCTAVGENLLMHPAAGPLARLEAHDVSSAEHQVARGAEPRQPSADHDHVGRHLLSLSGCLFLACPVEICWTACWRGAHKRGLSPFMRWGYWTTACCIAQRAAAARVDAPILA